MTEASQPGCFDEICGEDGVFRYLLDGKWLESKSGKTVSNYNPATTEVAFTFQACTTEEADEVFKAATEAQRGWSKTPVNKRAEILHAAAQVILQEKNAIAATLVTEIAKNKKSAMSEVVRTAEFLDFCVEDGIRLQGSFAASDSFPGQTRNKICMTSRVPLGVVLAIPPSNYPINLCISKIAPALITGNAIVIKSPTQGTAACIQLVQCLHKAGVPKGVIQIITGRGSEIGDYLVQHPAVSAVSFTGGKVGISICEKVGMIPVQMELGGKDNALVLGDADLDLAATQIVKGALSYNGQRCTAVKLVLAVEEVADELIPRILAAVSKLKVGSPESNADITAVVSKSSADNIQSLVEDAKSKGASLLTEFKRKDNLIWPCVIDNITSEMRLAKEEQFGPILPIMRVKDAEEAVAIANTSDLGLQASVFTQNINTAILIADQLQAGSIQINAAPARGPDHFPFQGFKGSGMGSQGTSNSLLFMTKLKNTVINLPSASYPQG